MSSEEGAQGVQLAALPEHVIGVLGMHRSGTSCLTGTLQSAGLFLGEHHTWNHHNHKGNRENQSIVDIHEAVLAANGGAWDKPPSTARWSAQQLEMIRHLLQQHSQEKYFGFKDPRALLLLDGWKSVCPDISFVGIYRHPNAVAASLRQRNDKSKRECLALWYAYNRALLDEYEKSPFPILSFDEDESVLDAKILEVAQELGLPGRAADDKFYSPELRHNAGRGAILLPAKYRNLYKHLKSLSR
ncbi:MAG: sulfotransferase [Gammaproteobacteria bacterium]|nr:sulfotransferase [Gammaproteobacteria bacterium]